MAARYHRLPSEVLALEAHEIALNVLIYQRGLADRAASFREILKTKAKSAGDVSVKILNWLGARGVDG